MNFSMQLLILVIWFNVPLFAAQPAPLKAAAAHQTATKCPIISHTKEAVLAERKQIAEEITRVVNGANKLRLIPPLIQLVASYCGTPMSWQKKREIRLPDDGCERHVCSIAQLSADKIAASYSGTWERGRSEKTSNKAAIWDLKIPQTNSQPRRRDTQTLDKYAGNYFTVLSDGIIKVDNYGILELVNTNDGSALPIDIGGRYRRHKISYCVPLAWAFCAVGTDDGTVQIVGSDHKITEVITAHSPFDSEVSALCPLPDNQLAVGDVKGNIRVIQGIPEFVADKTQDLKRKIVRRYNDHDDSDKQVFSVDAIVSWPEGIMAAVLRRRPAKGVVQDWHGKDRHIKFYDSSYQSLGVWLGSGWRIDGVCALPDRQLAVYFDGDDTRYPHTLAIYKFSLDRDAQAPLKLVQKLSFASDHITQSTHMIYGQHTPFYLSQCEERPTMAIGTASGTIQIWEKDVCKDCELGTTITKN